MIGGKQIHIPFALDKNGFPRHPMEVPKGKACGCQCQECGRGLVAYQQFKNVRTKPHFKHLAIRAGVAAAPCSGGRETMLHLMAKRVIKEKGSLLVPAFDETPKMEDIAGELHVGNRVTRPSREVCFDSLTEEAPIFGYRADLLGVKGTARLAIEIVVTHAVGAEKVNVLAEQQVSILEVRLDHLREVEFLQYQDIEHAIYGPSSKLRWLNFAPARQALKAAEEDLRKIVNARNDEIRKETKLERFRRERAHAHDEATKAREEELRAREQRRKELADALSKPEQVFSWFESTFRNWNYPIEEAAPAVIDKGAALLGCSAEAAKLLHTGTTRLDKAAGEEVAWIWRAALLVAIDRLCVGEAISNRWAFEIAISSLPTENPLRSAIEAADPIIRQLFELGGQRTSDIPEWTRRPYIIIDEYLDRLTAVGVFRKSGPTLVVARLPRELDATLAVGADPD